MSMPEGSTFNFPRVHVGVHNRARKPGRVRDSGGTDPSSISADMRLGTTDLAIVLLELLMVFGTVPLAAYIAYQIVKGDPTRYYWIIVLCTSLQTCTCRHKLHNAVVRWTLPPGFLQVIEPKACAPIRCIIFTAYFQVRSRFKPWKNLNRT